MNPQELRGTISTATEIYGYSHTNYGYLTDLLQQFLKV